MLGILLIYFIGRPFYKLAEEYQKNKWLYAIAGILIYYIGIFAGAAIIEIIYLLFLSGSMEQIPDIGLSLIALPIGICCCWAFYTILKKLWGKPANVNPTEALDGDLR